ncbi:MAG TPA: PD-(D/E)XK nuclease family protein [Verrucomicrobiae bacterium]|nr:PD-(D/E)XK nuclease family protein [Verrucomicrobiae bacterium]
MGIIRVVRDPHNLSYSRLSSFFACAARSGYEGFYDGFKRTASPYWLIGGGAVHYIVGKTLELSVLKGRTLDKDGVEKILRHAKGHLFQVLSGKLPPRGHEDRPSRLQTVMWMGEDERLAMEEDKYQKIVDERMWKYINHALSGIKAVALRCSIKSPFPKTLIDIKLGEAVSITSPRNPLIKIPIWGEIDLLEWHPSGFWIVTDWKTGSFNNFLADDLEGSEQMLIYNMGTRALYGVDPGISYFVSLNVFANDIAKHGAAVLEQERYRVQAKIRFEEQFPELVREMDDVWAVLNYLAYPPLTFEDKREREEWQPSSAKGQRYSLKLHVEQNRLLPNIGRQCGMCPARKQCQEDNSEDWKIYNTRQHLGNVVEPITTLPEDWIEPNYFPLDEEKSEVRLAEVIAFRGQQLRLVGRSSVLKRHTLKAREWDARGFFTIKKMVATLRMMKSLIPLYKGEACPCKKTERLPLFFMPYAYDFYRENEEHKRRQEEQGKTRSGEGSNKVRNLFDSETVRNILKFCPIENCPFANQCADEGTSQAS